MAKIGYARVGSREQDLDRQLKALEDISRVFPDELSGQSVGRPQLQTVLNYVREGNIVVVTELGRLGQNNKESTGLMSQIQIRRTALEVLNLPSMNGIEDKNLRWPINNLVIELYKCQAESERKRIKECQAQEIETARKEGEFKGRQSEFRENDPCLQHAFDLFLNGYSNKEVEEQTRINHRTSRRYRSRYSVTVGQREKQ